ncbi:MAG: glycine--tRNA ligase [Parcubacteria group bacterium]|nr:glycine--tRNA ligase [Parcubacteria group bacterium]
MPDLMEKIVSLAKRRGFVYPACEIYGGFANSYSYGSYGTELKNNIKQLWWQTFVHNREDIVGLDGPILLHPKLWEASGHTKGFNDALVDCKACQKRFRADHLVEEATGKDLEGQLDEMSAALTEIKCPNCGKQDWTEAREFNMMFKTQMNNVSDEETAEVYLRPETAGAIFVEYKNVLDSMRVKIPFGIAQIGKAFRNEIVAGNFIFRLREFEQMEIEYFISPDTEWKPLFEKWLMQQEKFALGLGADKKDLRHYEHPDDKRSHYSQKTVDIEYKFPFGFKELFGLAHRGNFDLTAHSKASGEKLDYFDQEKNERYVPHVLEPTFGLDRSLLVALVAAYHEEEVKGETRVVMKFPKGIAPIQLAILPLSKKEELSSVARDIFDNLKTDLVCEYDETQSIGKRYRRQDEIGTPYCVTVDFDSLEDKAVTVRDRDTMEQERVKIEELEGYLADKY